MMVEKQASNRRQSFIGNKNKKKQNKDLLSGEGGRCVNG